jgi:hypothetical protein
MFIGFRILLDLTGCGLKICHPFLDPEILRYNQIRPFLQQVPW